MAKFTKNIERMIADLRNDEKIQAMHRDNIDHAVARRARRAELCRLFLAAYRYRKNDRCDVMIRDHNDDKAANRARLVEMCNRFDNADDFMDKVREKVNILDPFYGLAYEVYSERKDKEIADLLSGAEKALDTAKKLKEAKKEAIRDGINQKFNGDVGKAIRAYSAVGKEDNQEFNGLFYEVARELQEEQENDLRDWCESKAEKLARLTGEDKAAIVDRLEGRTSDQENKRPTLSLNRAVSKRENKIITVGNKKAYQVGKGDYKHRNGRIIEN